MGHSEIAVRLASAAVEGERRVLGSKHPGTLNSIGGLGTLLGAPTEFPEHDQI